MCERVEVLRGPQGMLFGKNSSAGLLNITTHNPTEEFTTGFRTAYGSENLVNLYGYASGPLVEDKLLGRVSMYSNTSDGIIDNQLPGRTGWQRPQRVGRAHQAALAGDGRSRRAAQLHARRPPPQLLRRPPAPGHAGQHRRARGRTGRAEERQDLGQRHLQGKDQSRYLQPGGELHARTTTCSPPSPPTPMKTSTAQPAPTCMHRAPRCR